MNDGGGAVAGAVPVFSRHQWPAAVRMVAATAHRGVRLVVAVRRRFVRRRILMAVWVRAVWVRSRVDCVVAPDVKWGKRVRFTVEPRTHSAIRVAPGCKIGDDVRIALYGGTLLLGKAVDVRARCVFGVGGRLELAGSNMVSYGATFHCDDAITVGSMAVISEYCTLADLTHTFDGPHEWFLDNVTTSPIDLGENVWLGAKVTVARGVHIGSGSIIGANSVVVKDVPEGHLASGVPAQVVRPVGDRRAAAPPASRVS
jgi:acetyltransferase-like isoleucine patch superfamily enzyme